METDYEQLDLSPALVGMVKIFNENPNGYVNTLDFLKEDILSPAAGICRLKDKGAIIEKVTKTIIGDSGRAHKKIACYKIVGWC